MVTAETQIIVNCAASINFDDPLIDALEINYFGCKRMLELAQECRNIQVFTHVSTAYVNCNIMTGENILEEVYDLPGNQDCERIVEDIIKLGPQRVAEQEKAIIGVYPNTYTFTKSLAERMLKKRRGNLRVVIVRPSIIQGNYLDPFMGWTDTISASGFQMLMICTGALKYLHTKNDMILDLIPCDYVSNQILVQTVFSAIDPQHKLNVVNVTTTTKNPLRMKRLIEIMFEYIRHNPFYITPKNASPSFTAVGDVRVWKMLMYLTQELPIQMMYLYNKARGDDRKAERMLKLKQTHLKVVKGYLGFDHFTMYTFNYMSTFSERAWALMSD